MYAGCVHQFCSNCNGIGRRLSTISHVKRVFMPRTPWLCYYLFIHLWFGCCCCCFFFFFVLLFSLPFTVLLRFHCAPSTHFQRRAIAHNGPKCDNFFALAQVCSCNGSSGEKSQHNIESIDFCSPLHLLSLSHWVRCYTSSYHNIAFRWLVIFVRVSFFSFGLLICNVPLVFFALLLATAVACPFIEWVCVFVR